MAVTIDGNLGILSPDFEPNGSTVPTNGLYLPTTNTIAWATNSTERLRLDASGNLGLGVTPSAWSGFTVLQTQGGSFGSSAVGFLDVAQNAYYGVSGWIYRNTAAASYYRQSAGNHQWFQAASGTAGNAITFTQAMTLDASGNLGIGTTSPGFKLSVAGYSNVNSANKLAIGDVADYQARLYMESASETFTIENTSDYASSAILFRINGSERARIDSSGNLLVGTTSAPAPSAVPAGGLVVNNSSNNGYWSVFQSTGATANRGIAVSYTGASPNDTSNEAFYFRDTTTARFLVRSNGGISNYSANNTNLSDQRVKSDITPAPSYLDKINAIEVVNFKYKDQTFDDHNLGVIAQQVLSVAPELVDEDGFGETPEDGIPLMAIYETDLKYAMLKAIQELTQRLEALEAK